MSDESNVIPEYILQHAEDALQEKTSNLAEDSLSLLKDSVDKMVILKELHDKNKATNARVWAKYEELELQALNILKKNNLPSFDGTNAKISIKTKSSVKVPKDSLSKKKVFNWIESKYDEEVLLSYISINAQTLNKLFKDEEAKYFDETGRTDFTIDGLEPPRTSEALSLRKKK